LISVANLARLLLLGAVWGASFLFMRVAAPEFSPVVMILLRIGLAAAILWAVALAWRRAVRFKNRSRHFLILCTFNSTIPFVLWAYAAGVLPVSVLSILNATAPIWAALIGALWLNVRADRRTSTGLIVGIAGVLLLTGVEALHLDKAGWLAVAAALLATVCYAVASHYARKEGPVSDPFETTVGSMSMGLLSLAPVAVFAPWPAQWPSTPALASVLALAILSTAAAYLLYFRLVKEIGAAQALTVTYLIPLFGCLWGRLFLNEPIGWHTLAGGAAILLATALVTGVRFDWLRKRHLFTQ